MMTDRRLRGRAQGGYSLLEVLIAVLILSIGLLGLAGLQTTSLQSNQSAAQVSQATFLASDILDRMRANPDSARSGNYDVDPGQRSDDFSGGSLAAADVRGWLQQLETALPGVLGEDCNGEACGAAVNVDGNGYASVTVRWVDERMDEDDDQRVTRFTTESRL
ncbi:type IV pilus modification protein PilV [Aquisalimonas sp.]|uniref:type IV pilus modification protein PilV n=1 Tax=unclassified Aquisalimonas TaxID=2644645 RepID=UPI0025C64C71|nr:type IV pilus modification protein PilV [Aquisalimonas sp.]